MTHDTMMESLSSFPDMTFGIYDSLTLSKEKVSHHIDENQEAPVDSLSSLFGAPFGITDSLTLSKEKLVSHTTETNQDKVDTNTFLEVQTRTLRRGARRGGTVSVLTKLHDGPSSTAVSTFEKTPKRRSSIEA